MTHASPVALAKTEDHLLPSRHVGSDFHIWIGHPQPSLFRPSPLPPRALYMLDADLYFSTAVEMTRIMHFLYGELPPILVVGIAYGGGDMRAQGQLRSRDLTPTSVAAFEEMSMGEPLLPKGQRMGRAEPFLAFLRDEVRPFVAERFGVGVENSTLFGSSLGGLFSLWACLTAPDSFANYISASPSLWWDDDMMFALEERVNGARTDIDAGLYLTVGEHEDGAHVPMMAPYRMVSNVNRMADVLRARAFPSLRFETEVIAGETHTSVVPPALTRGLRKLARG